MKLEKTENVDIAIIGAGPVGLSLSIALADAGLKIALIERKPRDDVANPRYDGRDVAMTHFSVSELKKLGAWQKIPAHDIASLKEARVMDGASPFALQFDPKAGGKEALGHLVSNHLIRKALYERFAEKKPAELIDDCGISSIDYGPQAQTIALSNGRRLAAKLVVAADSRFSETRKRASIPAAVHDFKKDMLVCRMTHEKPHGGIAHELFHYEETLAILPLKGDNCSIVLTLAPEEMERVKNLPPEAFARDIEKRLSNRLGKMTLKTDRHTYPLVTVYAERFIAPRLALAGDAAVGMHPVTAHGFNFGLRSQRSLADGILSAKRLGLDIGNATMLARYNSAHRRATRPLYLATTALASLYTKTTPLAKLARKFLLRTGEKFSPVKKILVSSLMENHG